MIDFSERPHRRHNPLTDDWVLVSPHRTKRPWLGQKESVAGTNRPTHDPNCYLCPGNKRSNGESNPDYDSTYAFVNDFSALLPSDGLSEEGTKGLFRAEPAAGECRVLCFSPRHDLTLAGMDIPGIQRVVDLWVDQISDIGSRYKWVQIFENKGEAMGASNPHPHGQVWACDFLPTLIVKEDQCQKAYFDANGRQLLLDVAEQESAAGVRVVSETEHWILVVPFWATWPFEYLVMPKRAVQRLPDLTVDEKHDLAKILKIGLSAYDRLFDVSFPYSMGWHGAPTDGDAHPHWQLHAHFYPPLLRSASVRKFMVGFELLAEAQRDLTAESAAERLRDLAG